MSDPLHKPHVHETAPLHDPVDEWHDHTKDEKPQHAHTEVANAWRIMGVGIGLFLVIVFAVVVTYGFYVQQSARLLNAAEIVELSDTNAPPVQARMYRNNSRMELAGPYDWIVIPAAGDVPARALVRTPIERAKQTVAQDYAR